jgi:hypothetical protein
MGTGGTPSIKPPEIFAYAQAECDVSFGGDVGAALDPDLIDSVKQLEKKNDQAARAISIGQLNALQRLHLRPINVVVFDGSSGGCPREACS